MTSRRPCSEVQRALAHAVYAPWMAAKARTRSGLEICNGVRSHSQYAWRHKEGRQASWTFPHHKHLSTHTTGNSHLKIVLVKRTVLRALRDQLQGLWQRSRMLLELKLRAAGKRADRHKRVRTWIIVSEKTAQYQCKRIPGHSPFPNACSRQQIQRLPLTCSICLG